MQAGYVTFMSNDGSSNVRECTPQSKRKDHDSKMKTLIKMLRCLLKI